MHRKFYCLFLVLSSRNMERVNFGGKKTKENRNKHQVQMFL